MSSAETVQMNLETDGKTDSNGSYKIINDDVKPVPKGTKNEDKAPKKNGYNNVNSTSDVNPKNHQFYHKNCFTPLNNNNLYSSFNSKDSMSYGKNANMSKEFFNSLDSKLKNLNDAPNLTRQKRSQRSKPQDHRPMFVTTVKTGIFLEPPPELAAILGLQSYNDSNGSSGSTGSLNPSNNGEEVLVYSFASQPRVLHQKYHKARCQAAKLGSSAECNINKTNVRPLNRQKRDLNANQLKKTDIMAATMPLPYGNIMSDRRVVRGSTFTHLVPTTGADSQAARHAEARRRNLARRKAQGQQTRALRLRIGTPPPVDGRTHEQIQTEQYLEELFDHPLGIAIACQTDNFLDRPETPMFVPAKTGRDVETQIYPGDLFHFDTEVEPILEVLVGKTIEQALIEVLEEDELAAIREQQRRYKEIRLAERAEEQRLEEQERRKREEAEKRIDENEKALRVQKETEERVAAAVLTSGYIAELLPSVLDGLKEAGFLIDDIRRDVEENFMSWLMGEVTLEMQRMVDNKDLLSEIVREILETRAEIYRAMGEGSPQDQDKIASDEEPAASPLPGVEDLVLSENNEGEEMPADSIRRPTQTSRAGSQIRRPSQEPVEPNVQPEEGDVTSP